MTLVAGVDCSTQNTKVVVCDADTGEPVREGRAPHPDGTEVDAHVWWQAWQQASDGLLDGVEAVAVGGQQHGMVLVDDAGEPVRDALLWNDNRSAPQATALIEELGGPQAWADATGLVPVASFTVTKLRWVAEHEPEVAERASGVMLPHDWITHRMRGGSGEPTTDRGDVSGTGYWSPADGDYRPDLLRTAFGRELAAAPGGGSPRGGRPHARRHHARAGHRATTWALPSASTSSRATWWSRWAPAAPSSPSRTGRPPTPRASSRASPTPPAGSCRWCARSTPPGCVGAALRMAGAELSDLDRLALSVEDTEGLVLLPFLDGERTPALPDSTGLLHGLTRANATPAHLVRAAVEGMLCGLADAVAPLEAAGVTPRRIVLIGGAARSAAVQRIAAGALRAAGRAARAGRVRRPRRGAAGRVDAVAGRHRPALEA